MFSKFEYDGKLNPTFVEGPFQLPLSSIRAYLAEPITPRFIHVGSAGVTRPERPGLDLCKQLPAVRLNKELGSILTLKLRVLFFSGKAIFVWKFNLISLTPSRSLRSLGRSNSNNTQTTFSNDFSNNNLSFSGSHQFSHNLSCSMSRNSTENHEIWNAGEGMDRFIVGLGPLVTEMLR